MGLSAVYMYSNLSLLEGEESKIKTLTDLTVSADAKNNHLLSLK